MATVAHAFSPKEFQVWIAEDNSDAGATGISATAMHQLDVDSVGFPSLPPKPLQETKSMLQFFSIYLWIL